MSFEEFEDLAARVVTVEAFESESPYGAVSYGDAVEARARVELGPVRITSPQGDEIVSHVRVFLGIPVGLKDRITLPDPYFPNSSPAILQVRRVDDETGAHHWVVFC